MTDNVALDANLPDGRPLYAHAMMACAEGDLEPTPKGEAMDCGDHRNLHFLPNPRRTLRHVGRAFLAPRKELLHQVG